MHSNLRFSVRLSQALFGRTYMRISSRRVWTLGLLALAASSALAVQTQHFLADSEAEFHKGTSKNIVVTSLGELRLSRELKTVAELNASVTTVLSLAQGKDGTLYVGTGPEGEILAV